MEAKEAKTGRPEMLCVELVELVTAYLEDTIEAVERERVETHLGDCAWCDRYVAQTQLLVGALERIGAEEGSSAAEGEAWSQALSAFREASR